MNGSEKSGETDHGYMAFMMLLVYRKVFDKNYKFGATRKTDSKSETPEPTDSAEQEKPKAPESQDAIPGNADAKGPEKTNDNDDSGRDKTECRNVTMNSFFGKMQQCAGSRFFKYGDTHPELIDLSNVGLQAVNYVSKQETKTIAARRNETQGLTNVDFVRDESWPKVERGKVLLAEALRASQAASESKEQLIERLFDDVLGCKASILQLANHEDAWKSDLEEILKESIFIPRLGGSPEQRRKMDTEETRLKSDTSDNSGGNSDDIKLTAVDGSSLAAASPETTVPTKTSSSVPAATAPDAVSAVKATSEAESSITPAPIQKSEPAPSLATHFYGTTQQTIILVTREKRVTFVERTLYDEKGRCKTEGRDRRYEYDIEKAPDDEGGHGRRSGCMDFMNLLSAIGAFFLLCAGGG